MLAGRLRTGVRAAPASGHTDEAVAGAHRVVKEVPVPAKPCQRVGLGMRPRAVLDPAA